MSRALRDQRYNMSEKGRARHARYNGSVRGRARYYRYEHSTHGYLTRRKRILGQLRVTYEEQLSDVRRELAEFSDSS